MSADTRPGTGSEHSHSLLLEGYKRKFHPDEQPLSMFRTLGSEVVSAVRGQEVKPVIFVRGIPLGGTTHGLKHVAEVTGQESNSISVIHDCSSVQNPSEIVAALSRRLTGAVTTNRIGEKVLHQLTVASISGEVEHFIQAVRTLTSTGVVPVFLLDDFTALLPEVQAELIRKIIIPLYPDIFQLKTPQEDKSPVFVVATNDAPDKMHSLRDYNIRARGEIYAVESMTPEVVRDRIEQNGITATADLIRFSAGNPLITQAIIDMISNSPDGSLNRKKFLKVIKLYRERLMKQVPDELHEIMEVAATLRHFQVHDLREILQGKGLALEKTDYYFMKAKQALERQTPYVDIYRRDLSAAEIHPTVRGVLTTVAELNHDPNAAQRHDLAAERQSVYMTEHVPFARAIIEQLYHIMERDLIHGLSKNERTHNLLDVVIAAASIPTQHKASRRGFPARPELVESELNTLREMVRQDQELRLGMPEDAFKVITA